MTTAAAAPRFRRGGAWRRAVLQLVRRFEGGEDTRARDQALLTLGLRVIGAGLAFVSQALVARWLGLEAYGVFALAWVFVVVCGSLAPIGFGASVIRFASAYRRHGLAGRLAGLVRFSSLTVFAVAFAVSAFGIAAVEFAGPAIDPSLARPLQLACLAIPLFALTELGRGLARAQGWMITAYAPGFLVRPVAMLAALAILAASGARLTAELAIGCMVFGALIAAAGQGLAIASGMTRALTRTAARYRPRVWLMTSLPFLLVDGFYLLMSQVDVLMLSAFVRPSEVAIYFAAAKVTALLAFVSFAVSAVAAPALARLQARAERRALEDTVHKFIGWTFWPTLAGAALLLVAARPALWLFGNEFTGGAPLVAVLSLGLVAQAAVGPIKYLNGMTGQQNAMAMALAAAALANVGLNLVLIAALGPLGAALATVLSSLLAALLLAAVARRRLGIWSIIGAPRRFDAEPAAG